MTTKPDIFLTEALVKEYDKLINIYSQHLSADDYNMDKELHHQEGRVDAFKECILGQQAKEEE